MMIPESPYYYLKKGQREEAKESIVWLKGKCNDDDLDILQKKVEEQMEMKGSFLDIFKTPACLKAFIIVEFLYACQRFSGATFLCAFATVVIPESWFSPADSFMNLLIVWIIASFLASSLIDKFNRRTLLAISCLGSGLAMCAATVWYYLRDFTEIDTSNTNYLPLVFLVISGVFYCIGIVSIPIIIQGELFPVNLKSIGSALACITANLCSGIFTQFFYDITNNIGMYFNFLIMGMAPLICIVFFLL
uniref:Facilitated trehalose transporter Tret1 n=1 Tax=Lygus hesperus TaxID=30085 RepID=A0A0A9YTX6_LYGHE